MSISKEDLEEYYYTKREHDNICRKIAGSVVGNYYEIQHSGYENKLLVYVKSIGWLLAGRIDVSIEGIQKIEAGTVLINTTLSEDCRFDNWKQITEDEYNKAKAKTFDIQKAIASLTDLHEMRGKCYKHGSDGDLKFELCIKIIDVKGHDLDVCEFDAIIIETYKDVIRVGSYHAKMHTVKSFYEIPVEEFDAKLQEFTNRIK